MLCGCRYAIITATTKRKVYHTLQLIPSHSYYNKNILQMGITDFLLMKMSL